MKRLGAAAHFLFGVCLLLFATAAAAQQPSQAQANAIRQSCRSDYQSYCASVPTGGAAALQCLQSHQNELSGACQTAISSATGGTSTRPSQPGAQPGAPSAPPASPPPPMSPREKMAIMRRSCGGDFRAFCRGVPLGGGEAMRCLAQNQSRLSPACQGVLAQAQGAR